MSEARFAPIRPHFADAPEPEPTQVRNRKPLTRKEKATLSSLRFQVLTLEAEAKALEAKLEKAGLISPRQQMAWNRDQTRYMPITPYWDMDKPGDARR